MRTRNQFLPVAAAVFAACSGSGSESGASASPEPKPSTYAQKILGALDRGAIEKTRSDMIAVRTAINAYGAQTGESPDAPSYHALKARLAPTFIRVLPRNDAWGSPFVFESSGAEWKLIAPGADGQDGTGDDIVLEDGGFTKLPDGFREM